MSTFLPFRIRRTHLLIVIISLLVLFSAVHIQTAIADKENLVVAIAQWRQAGGDYQDVQQRTLARLEKTIRGLGLSVELTPIPVELNNADDVEAVAALYNADVLVWGWYDDIAVRGYVDLANATEENGMTNSLDQFLKSGGSPDVIRVLNALNDFDYNQDGVSFCVPRWTP